MSDILMASRAALSPQSQKHPRPIQVWVDGNRTGQFEDIRDAISSAQITKRARAGSIVCVDDKATGLMVIEISR